MQVNEKQVGTLSKKKSESDSYNENTPKTAYMATEEQRFLNKNNHLTSRPLVSMASYLQMSRVPTSPEAKSLSGEMVLW